MFIDQGFMFLMMSVSCGVMTTMAIYATCLQWKNVHAREEMVFIIMLVIGDVLMIICGLARFHQLLCFNRCLLHTKMAYGRCGF